MLASGKFSLYSTDTEERVVSMSRGLDRCAALLKSLLSPEKQGAPGSRGEVQRGQIKGKLSDKLTKKANSTKQQQAPSPTSDGRPRQTASSAEEQLFPGSSKHVRHPNTCSTPRKVSDLHSTRHVRSATEPKPVGDLQPPTANAGTDQNHYQARGEPLRKYVQEHTAHDQRPTRRRHVRAHRRLKSEPRHKRSRSADANKEKDGSRHRGDQDLLKPSSGGNDPANFHNNYCGLETHCPAVVPLNFHRRYLQHNVNQQHPCCVPYCGSHFTSVPLPPSLACPHCHPQAVQPWLWPSKRTDYAGGSSQRCNSAPSERTCPEDSGVREALPTDADAGPAFSISSVNSIQLLSQEMMTTLQNNIDAVKRMIGPNSAVHLLETIEHSVKLYCSQLCLQCQKLVLSSSHSERPPSPSHSPSTSLVNHLQSQLQQLEEEKSQLLERLINSETAYSEVKGQLDHSNKRIEALQREIDSSSSQIVALKKEVEQTCRLLTQLTVQKKTAEEKLQEAQMSAKDSLKQEKARSEDLQRQVDIVSKELLKSKQEHLKESARFSQAQVSLDRVQDEIQLMKLSLSEKETQLLQSQDQQLGLRQCLAYFLSDLKLHHRPPSPSSTVQPGGSYYTVSQAVVQKLQSVINDGAIEQFLANYTSRGDGSCEEVGTVFSLQDTLNQSQDFGIDQVHQRSPGTVHVPYKSTEEPASDSLLRGKENGGITDTSLQHNVITPLGDTAAVQWGSQRTDDLESNSTLVDTSSREMDLTREERLVEGSSVKSQPRTTYRRHACALAVTAQTQQLSRIKECHKHHQLIGRGQYLRGQECTSTCKSALSPSSSSSLQTSVTGTSCRTTASEAEFRSDLANLDADIARLQMQFRVAMLTPLP